MPNVASSKKRLRQSVVRRARNRTIKSALRTQTRKLRAAMAEGNMEQVEVEFRITVKKLDQAAARNIIHANAAARTKSRLSAAIKALKS